MLIPGNLTARESRTRRGRYEAREESATLWQRYSYNNEFGSQVAQIQAHVCR